MSKLTALIVIPIALLGVKRLQETTKEAAEETPEETIKPLIPEYVVNDVRPGEIGPSGRLKL